MPNELNATAPFLDIRLFSLLSLCSVLCHPPPYTKPSGGQAGCPLGQKTQIQIVALNVELEHS